MHWISWRETGDNWYVCDALITIDDRVLLQVDGIGSGRELFLRKSWIRFQVSHRVTFSNTVILVNFHRMCSLVARNGSKVVSSWNSTWFLERRETRNGIFRFTVAKFKGFEFWNGIAFKKEEKKMKKFQRKIISLLGFSTSPIHFYNQERTGTRSRPRYHDQPYHVRHWYCVRVDNW